ncbi:hypothetical protein CROQUDRAFT_91835 [Cronartium quercuum f. sp. fusiforme G11]|uniref:Uncharacterized protein n=1 Tax=Cronartium quercuum f. sp. fusiforme G11 TaxID=708437 RepID=A0A9P6TC68_9BASI|nr:hypothetical protein CROQUDRAFT_91835 [Cronartium quercuum f. sp. fusiforme G11]
MKGLLSEGEALLCRNDSQRGLALEARTSFTSRLLGAVTVDPPGSLNNLNFRGTDPGTCVQSNRKVSGFRVQHDFHHLPPESGTVPDSTDLSLPPFASLPRGFQLPTYPSAGYKSCSARPRAPVPHPHLTGVPRSGRRRARRDRSELAYLTALTMSMVDNPDPDSSTQASDPDRDERTFPSSPHWGEDRVTYTPGGRRRGFHVHFSAPETFTWGPCGEELVKPDQ